MSIQKTCQICGMDFYVSKFNKDAPNLYVCEDCDKEYHISERWKRGEKRKHKRKGTLQDNVPSV